MWNVIRDTAEVNYEFRDIYDFLIESITIRH